ncbi:MAG: adenylate/guanylate cyclase domain-containing protein [Vicinamibacterales bacterium]
MAPRPDDRVPQSPPRRTLTMLFSDLSDSTLLASSGEPEDYLDVLNYLRRQCLEIVPRHGGTIVDFSGDGFLAMFGHPEPTESDARHAVEAALEMHAVIRKAPFRGAGGTSGLTLHSGVHSGLVLVIENDLFPGRHAVVGETPNLAAKLSDAAARDEILVSEVTLGSDQHFFEVQPRGSVAISGKAGLVPALQVLGLSSTNTRFEARSRRGLTPFVGRSDARTVLDGHLREACAGTTRLVYVVGPAGLGKTRLIEEFLTSGTSAGCRVHRGYCDSDPSAQPLLPFVQMLRASAGSERPPHLGPLTPAEFCAHIQDLAAQGPQVIFIDDWHWADDASRQMLRALLALKDVPLLIVSATRFLLPVDPHGAGAHELPLHPLGLAETIQAIRTLRPDLEPFTIPRIATKSGGYPLFVEELCHVASPDRLVDDAQPAGNSLAWLEALIEARVSLLPPEQVRLARTAAVIGTIVPTWLLERVSGYKATDPLVVGLTTADLMLEGELQGTLRFKHGVTRDAIYKSVGRRERSQTHLRVGELLEQVDQGSDQATDSLAYHFNAAGDAPRAIKYAEQSGDRALAAGALDRARHQYQVALTHLRPLHSSPDAARRYLELAQRMGVACVYDPTRAHLEIFRDALAIAQELDDEAELARAEYWLGYIHYALGNLAAAFEHCERAAAHCTTARAAGTSPQLDALNVQIRSTFAQAKGAAGEYDGVLEQLDLAADVKRRHRSGTRPAVGMAYTLACKGGLLADCGDFEAAHACFAEAMDVIRGRNSPVEASVLAWKSAVHVWRGEWHQAIDTAHEVQTIADRIESLYVHSMAAVLIGYSRWRLEPDLARIDELVQATQWLEERDKRLYISLNHGWIATAMVDAGQFDKARSYIEQALARARVHDSLGESMAYRALARMAHAGHAPEPARHYLDAALAASRRRRSKHEEAVTLAQIGIDLLRAAQPGEGRAAVDQARAMFRTLGMRWHEAAMERELAAAPR